jgi:hypothetical protein
MMVYPTTSGGNVLIEGQHWRGKLQRPQGGDLAIHLDKGLLFDGRARGLAQLVTAGTGSDPLIVDGRAAAGRLECQLLDPAASRDPLQLTGMFAGDELTGTLTGPDQETHDVVLHKYQPDQPPAPGKPPGPAANQAVVSYEVETNIGDFEFVNWSFAVVVPLGTWKGRTLWGNSSGNVTIIIDPCAPIQESEKWHVNFDLSTWWGAPVAHFYTLRGEISVPDKWVTLLPGSCAWPDDRWVDVQGRMKFHRDYR